MWRSLAAVAPIRGHTRGRALEAGPLCSNRGTSCRSRWTLALRGIEGEPPAEWPANVLQKTVTGGPPFRAEQVVGLASVRSVELDGPSLGGDKSRAVERPELDRSGLPSAGQLAASPATVAGTPSNSPIGSSSPLLRTSQPKSF